MSKIIELKDLIKDPEVGENKLVFTHFIDDSGDYGIVTKFAFQPADYDSVININGRLFYAYQNGRYEYGRLYIGEYK